MGNTKKCVICGDEESCKYYTWSARNNNFLEYKNKTICNKHYVQLNQYKRLLDNKPSKHEKRNYWTDEEILILEDLYSKQVSMKEMSKILNRTMGSISYKAGLLGFTDKYMKPNNAKFKALYQDYDWCYEHFINRRMTHQEMADELGVTKRVIQKWCVEKHKLSDWTIRHHLTLNKKQRELIMFSLLGDGHIDKREDQPLFIVSHAENQKDYLYWKYNILRNLCNKEPTYYPETIKVFNDKEYECQPSYRLCTKIIDELSEIRNMSKYSIIEKLNEFGLSILVLDDAYRGNLWNLCLAEYTDEEKDLFIKICNKKFGLEIHKCSDDRYVNFTAKSSCDLDNIILRNIPNELDIIQYKIFNNDKIRKLAQYKYVNRNGEKISLITYCKENGLSYFKYSNIFKDNNISEITEDELRMIKVG